MWQYAFSTLAWFSAEESVSLTGDRYLFWKTAETKQRVPAFDDKGERELVLRTWKLVEARQPALKEAKSLAEEAAKANKPLKEIFADRPDLKVITPPEFSWITFGDVAEGRRPSLSAVEGVDLAGEEFMKTVFGLEPGQVGAAMNAPQTIAYVIRVSDFDPSHEKLWREFENADFQKYLPVSYADSQKTMKAWVQAIKDAAGFQWVSEHEPAEQSPEPEPLDED